MKTKLTNLLIFLVLTSCSGELTRQSAMSHLESLPEYKSMFYAPMHVGRQVLTGENHSSPQRYIDSQYGTLIDEGLVKVDIIEKNAWRTVIEISLTDKGSSMTDPRRSDKEHVFVAVCRVRPVAIDTLVPQGKDSVLCKYQIQQQGVTTFGRFLGFEEGKRYKTTLNLSR